MPDYSSGSLTIDTRHGLVDLDVRSANTPAAKARGLMGVTQLAENAGMVFLSGSATTTPFWMKDTTIPLSIAFWNGERRIVDMLDMTQCTSDPCPLYRSSEPYVGAVEVNRGFFQEHGVKVGDRVELQIRYPL